MKNKSFPQIFPVQKDESGIATKHKTQKSKTDPKC